MQPMWLEAVVIGAGEFSVHLLQLHDVREQPVSSSWADFTMISLKSTLKDSNGNQLSKEG